MRRYLFYPFDFDTRAAALDDISPNADVRVRRMQEDNQKHLLEGLKFELGEWNFEQKIKDFKAAGMVSPSIVSYHNAPFRQAHYAFILGLYYPAILACCALGERILNHLIIDLRDQHRSSPRYKEVHGKESFDNWTRSIDILDEWQVFLLPETAGNLRALATIRHRWIHFTADAQKTLRDDALKALQLIQDIIYKQFGYGAWSAIGIKGTVGLMFLSTESLQNSFVKTFILPHCPLLGIELAISFEQGSIVFHDRIEYENREISDEEFAIMFMNRGKNVVSSKLPPPNRAAGPRFAVIAGELTKVQFDWAGYDARVAAEVAGDAGAAYSSGSPKTDMASQFDGTSPSPRETA